MRNNKTIYQILLDQSGSMQPRVKDVIEGYNGQIDQLANSMKQFPEQELRVSLSYFNSTVTHQYKDAPIDKMPRLMEYNYRPNGSTALLDAIGECTFNVKSLYGREIEEDRASVVMLIFTDGMENSSRSFSFERIKSLMEELEGTDRWLFSFVGSDIRGIEFATSLNFRRNNMKMYDVMNSKESLLTFSMDIEKYVSAKCQLHKPPKDLF